MSLLMLGALAMASLTAGLFFLRFWRNTRDRFFLYFAVAFFIEGLDRVVVGLSANSQEQEPFFYLVRLIAFVLILVAIAEKNWKSSKRVKPPQDKE